MSKTISQSMSSTKSTQGVGREGERGQCDVQGTPGDLGGEGTVSHSCFGGICGVLARGSWKRLGVGDLEPHFCQPFPSLTSTSTPELRQTWGLPTLSHRKSPAEAEHLGLVWLYGALEGSQPLRVRTTLSSPLECPCPWLAPDKSHSSSWPL